MFEARRGSIEDKGKWDEINNHLNTNATHYLKYVKNLGKENLGRNPIVGDCFSGGGSIPFEAARMGLKFMQVI